MSYANPEIPLIDNPIGIDAAIQSIQLALSELPWLEKVFGRAWEHKEQDQEGNLVRYPKCFVGKDAHTKKGEYLNVLPNDNFASMCFFAVRDREFFIDYVKTGQNSKERQIAVVIWGNLNKIDPSKDYIYTEELKLDVEKILNRNPYVKEILAYFDERVEQVFDGLINEAKYARYTVDDVKAQYLMHPFWGCRFDVTVGYLEEC